MITCCFLLFLRAVLHTFSHCESCVLFSVAAIAASWWTSSCLHCCCVAASGAFDKAPVVQLDSDLIAPGRCVFGDTTCCCGKGETDDTKKWEVLRNI